MSSAAPIASPSRFANSVASTPAVAAHRSRITSIDALRGLVMLIMLMDHVRETLYLHLQVTDPMDVAATPPQVFFSRLAAHFCAPVFVFLTGLGAWLYANPPSGTPRPVRDFLLKRGLLMLVLEVTVVSFAWTGDMPLKVIYLQVIWAVGIAMIVLAFVHKLSPRLLAAIGLVIVCGHNALAGINLPPDHPLYLPWTLLLHRGWALEDTAVKVRLTYPALPWVGVILLGWVAGPLYGAAFDSL
ncbi:MAG TPA: heparan-alpha-glucosaminide N-acetyltransferase domain-containing protein, partial [Methylibium sp.]